MNTKEEGKEKQKKRGLFYYFFNLRFEFSLVLVSSVLGSF